MPLLPADEIIELLDRCDVSRSHSLLRFRGEVHFAAAFAGVFPDKTDEWLRLVAQAVEEVVGRADATDPADMPELVGRGEATLAPIGRTAKTYTIHCSGHAHIDMNWTWPLFETVATAHDTYVTLDRLIQLFPGLRFGQSQVAIYQMMQEYCPEVWEIIKRRIDDGSWQVTAGSWVEGDKNMASGESLCRQILYSKRCLRITLGCPMTL